MAPIGNNVNSELFTCFNIDNTSYSGQFKYKSIIVFSFIQPSINIISSQDKFSFWTENQVFCEGGEEEAEEQLQQPGAKYFFNNEHRQQHEGEATTKKEEDPQESKEI